LNFFKNEVTVGLLEIPDEISLIIPLAGCGHRCKNCHSPHYQDKNNGIELTPELLFPLLDKYKNKVSCICFFGGEDFDETACYLNDIKHFYNFKTALYSGFDCINTLDQLLLDQLDYLKVGHYNETLGGLDSKTTNQKLFKIENSDYIDITYKFWRNND